MSATSTMVQAGGQISELKRRLKNTWMTGDYDLFSRFMETGTEEFFRRLHITLGTRMLDVGCGAGQLALIAARAGIRAAGCDIATNWLERARQRATLERLEVSFDEGDAEALPYKDGEFDVVASFVGAMFAPQPEVVAAEMTRVCRPGGRIAMANWTPGGFVGQMFKTIARYIAPSGMPSPVLWGDENTVGNRLREGIVRLTCTPRLFHFDYPFPPAEVVDFFRINYGPMSQAFASLDGSGQANLRSELVDLWASWNQASDSTTKVDGEYLEVVAIRGPGGVTKNRKE